MKTPDKKSRKSGANASAGKAGSTEKKANFDKAFIDRLDELIRQAGGQSAMARKIGMSLGGLQGYLAGGQPTRPVLIKIADVTGVRLEWLMTGEGPKYSEFAELAHRAQFLIDRLGGPEAAAAKSQLRIEYLQRMVSGSALPDSTYLHGIKQLASAADVDVVWLRSGTGSAPDGFVPLPPQVSATRELWASGVAGPRTKRPSSDLGAGRAAPALSDEFVFVPRYDIEASAGPGALLDQEKVVDHLAFKEDFVRRTLRADPKKLVLITGIGDSMEPTIRSGDLLLVDTGVTHFLDDAIYVISIDGALYVKRIQRFFGGAVAVKSDNAAYVEQTLSPGEAEAVRVAGRVRWIGRLI